MQKQFESGIQGNATLVYMYCNEESFILYNLDQPSAKCQRIDGADKKDGMY